MAALHQEFSQVSQRHILIRKPLSPQPKWRLVKSRTDYQVTARLHCGFRCCCFVFFVFVIFSHSAQSLCGVTYLFHVVTVTQISIYVWCTVSVTSTLCLAAMLRTFSHVAPTLLFFFLLHMSPSFRKPKGLQVWFDFHLSVQNGLSHLEMTYK